MHKTHMITLGFVTSILVACAGADSTGPVSPEGALLGSGSGGSSQAFALRVKCEVRSGRRSRASVDGNNLTPANGMWSARIASGGKMVAAASRQGLGDEVEFDFDSNAADIAAGATPIPVQFIVINAGGPDVTAELLDAVGQVVATGGAECRSR